jgi:hypothetical protein
MPIVRAAADEAGREIDPEHFGALVAYLDGEMPDLVAQVVQRRRPDKDPEDLIPTGLEALRRRLEEFVEVGASKFVVVPITEPTDWKTELERLGDTLLPLQN